MCAENYSVDASKLPRFFPTAPFLSFVEFYSFENSKLIILYKARFEGNVVNLSPLLMKNAFNPSQMIG